MNRRIELNCGWQFLRLDEALVDGPAVVVDLPHSPFVADLDGREHWFGRCEYRRPLETPSLRPDERCFLWIGAAMQQAEVFVDGQLIATHAGGYLPFEVDLTDALRRAPAVELVLRLDNRHNPEIPPGKAYDQLDFCWYGGLYRGAELRIKPAVHITDPLGANEAAGGGVFVRTLEASPVHAVVSVRTHVRNQSAVAQAIRVRVSLRHGAHEVALATSDPIRLSAGASQHVAQSLTLDCPHLWNHDAPELHDAIVTLVDLAETPLDSVRERFGIRRIAFSRSGGFVVNGRRLRLRGTNRHQEYPRVGYAAPRAAQYRDARRIKEAGFDYVRLSHYPQSPDFLDACDELGLVVMTCLPGWQFLGGEQFRSACFETARQMIRRDRNHPSIVLWELSLNETPMDDAFMAQLHAIGHEEYPGDQMYTCGWIDRYDVFTHSRQHGEIHRWRNGDKALVIAEYGDWEFFARNEGFDQKSGAGLFDRWSTARQFRSDGERGLRQQAFNHMVALSDTLASPAVLDGQWAMFDYARGYDAVRAAAGVMDIFRLPKFSYHFYRSQRDPGEHGTGWEGGPVVFIASHWTPLSNLRILVFSNCEEVELRLNGAAVGRSRPAQMAITQHLAHPPIFFDLPQFASGVLEAVGYLDGRPYVSHAVATPLASSALELTVDDLGVLPAAGESDVLFVHAAWHDERGSLCVFDTAPVVFSLTGAAEIVGPATVAAEAGIASVVVRVPAHSAGFVVDAAPARAGTVRPAQLRWPGRIETRELNPSLGVPASASR
ncbi:hypothetical protein DB347_06945 [Opitutaceae bacterium EW11]|nr:hypothetical protein DB347_06945 [Opitutaceae bacterium EW11]